MKKITPILAFLLGLIFIALAFIYWSKQAGSLPSYFPGFEAGSLKIHYKHGVASLLLGLGTFAYAWFASGKKSQ